jgi:cytochrome P450
VTSFPIGAGVTLEELETDPHPLLARLREHEPVSWLPVLERWLVTRRDLALQVMRDPQTFTVDDPRFSTAQVVGVSMLSLDGAEHTAHRAPFAPPFRLDAVRARFTQLVDDEVNGLIDAIASAGRADLRRAVAAPLSVRMMIHALGLEDRPLETVLGWYEAIVASVTRLTAGEPVPDAGRTAFAELGESLERAFDRDAEASLVAAAAASAGELTPAGVVSNAAVLLFGGIETTEGMIANALWHILGDEQQRLLVESDPELLTAAAEESLRLEPAAAFVDRYATRGVELNGVRVRRREPVTVSIAAANRDPGVFPDPDRFDVTRTNAHHHVSFAHGPHVCLGMHLARLEARVAIGSLLRRLPGLRLDPARPSAPRGLVFRKPPELDALWD